VAGLTHTHEPLQTAPEDDHFQSWRPCGEFVATEGSSNHSQSTGVHAVVSHSLRPPAPTRERRAPSRRTKRALRPGRTAQPLRSAGVPRLLSAPCVVRAHVLSPKSRRSHAREWHVRAKIAQPRPRSGAALRTAGEGKAGGGAPPFVSTEETTSAWSRSCLCSTRREQGAPRLG